MALCNHKQRALDEITFGNVSFNAFRNRAQQACNCSLSALFKANNCQKWKKQNKTKQKQKLDSLLVIEIEFEG